MTRIMGNSVQFVAVFLLFANGALSQVPACYNSADPCAPLYPCPVGTQVPQGADCKSYYQCVTPRDWVFLDNGCSGFGDFNPNLCMCDNLVPCESIDGICPDGVTSPPADPGIAPVPCAPAGPCTAGADPVPDIYTCTRYFNCPAGTWEPAECASGEIFDPNVRGGCVSARPNNLDLCNDNPCFALITTTPSPVTGPPSCYNGAEPCAPQYPCPVDVQVPVSANCKSFYQCVTPNDWVFFDQGCIALEDFDVNLCSCQNDVTCSDVNVLCPGGISAPPDDPGVEAEPCVDTTLCNENSTDVADVNTCSRYFRCTLITWSLFTCPSGEIFDPNEGSRGCVEARSTNIDVCNDKVCFFPPGQDLHLP